MAPKAAEKKTVPKKAVAYVQKQIDSSRYLRKQEYLEPINEIPGRQLTGIIANVDNVFPEWSIAAQNWNDNQDSDEYVKYPIELKYQDLQSIRASLNLEPPESKVKSKAESRKLKDNSSEFQLEILIDEEGRKLPRVVFRDDSVLTQYDQQMLFRRTYSSEQTDRKALQDNLLQSVSDIEQSSADAPSEDAVRRAESQRVYDAALAERDVRLEKPEGSEIDHNMCAVFRIVSELAMRNSGVDRAEGDKGGCKLLWNSIYPQLPSGRPVYNASGKYAVKLFLAGKWRKVIVTDLMPMTADGPATASSREPLELWPAILSKAVYSVYTACGYHNAMPTLFENSIGRRPHSSNSTSNTHKTSFFIGFAVHLLTGWQPSTPRAVADTIDLDIQRSRGLLQEIIFGGAPNILSGEIPAVSPPAVRLGGRATGTDIVLGDLAKCQTKKHFKEEYSLRFAERARVMEEIGVREELTRRLSAALSSPFSEGFLLCFQAPSSSTSSSSSPSSSSTAADSNLSPAIVTSVPILGICLAPEGPCDRESSKDKESSKEEAAKDLTQFLLDEGQEDSDFALLNSVKLLIKWRTAPAAPKPVDPDKEALPADIAILLQGINDPLPPCTVIESQWVSLRELAARQAYIVGVDTNTRLPHQTLFNWHWLPLAVEKGIEKAPRATAKGRVAELLRNPSVLCGDQGAAPPMLLTLNTQDFFSAAGAGATPSADLGAGVTGTGTHIQDTVSAQGLGSPIPAATPVALTPRVGGPLSPYLSISLSVHADLVLPDSTESISSSLSVSLSPRIPQSAGKRPLTSTAGSPVVTGDFRKDPAPPSPAEEAASAGVSGSTLPSDITIVLQELRTDNKEPLVMRIELSSATKIPITRTTFHIPSDRIEKAGKLVFWVRIFSKTSLHLRVACAVPVDIGDVEDVWAGLGGSVLVREGEAAPSRANTEQLLFRVPLQICALDSSDRAGPGHLFEGGEGSELLNVFPSAARASASASVATGAGAEEHKDFFVTAFLHIPDRKAARSVSVLLGTSRGETVSLPRIDGNFFLLSGPLTCLRTLIGRCFVSDSSNRPASSALLPAFKWKLVVISSAPLETPSPASLSPSIVRGLQQRYRGVYRPNKKLILFRDVYSLDPLSFPLALRITTLPLRSTSLVVETLSSSSSGSGRGGTGPSTSEGDVSLNIAEGISILVRLYRKSDRHLVSESRARGVLQLYQIALEGLALPHEAAPVSAPDTPSKTRKAPSKKAGDIKSALGKKSAQGDEVEFILECSLDETAMIVPPHWHSRVPFSFCIDAADASTANSQPMCRKGKDGLEEKLPQAVLPSLPSMCPSASLPQFQWQVDVLAGTVGDVSHDTYDLERQVEWKNGWEEASQGRAERAAAAMAYVLEKKVQRAALLLAVEPEPEPQMIPIGGGKVTAATPSPLSTDRLVDLLALALEREEQRPLLAERETRLLGLQEYKEHIEDWRGTAPSRIEPSALEAQKALRAERMETSEADSRRMCAMMLDLNEMLRSEAASRVQSLAAQAATGQASIAQLWEAREGFRGESLLKAQAFKVQLERIAGDLAASAAADLALCGDSKDRRVQRAKASTPTSKRQSVA